MIEKELFEKAFAKAKKYSASQTKTGITEYLSEELSQYNTPGTSDKNLRRYYNKYLLGNDDLIAPTKELLDTLSMFLELSSYEDFVDQSRHDDGVEAKSDNKRIDHDLSKIENEQEINSDVSQKNLFSLFNKSFVNKPKGKIRQSNFFSFGNKQDVNADE